MATFIVPLAILLGTVGAALLTHHDVAASIDALRSPQGQNFTLCAMLLVSLWATKESLADRYRTFQFATQPTLITP
jgi:hypothetical protein